MDKEKGTKKQRKKGIMKLMSIFLLATLFTIAVVHCEYTEEQIQVLLDEFNAERSSVSPTAANMRELRWCGCLAEIADNYLQSCPDIGEKNSNLMADAREAGCSAVDVGIGEAIFEIPSDGDSDPIGTLKAKCTSCMDDDGDCDVECGRYHQIINAETYSVGCAKISRSELCGGVGRTFLCYFSVPTNTEGPYIEGEKCSGCAGEYSGCSDEGLCIRMESPTESPTRPHNHHNHGHHNNHNHDHDHSTKPPKSDEQHNHGHGHKSHDHNHGTKHDHAHNHGNGDGDMNGKMSVGQFVGSSSSASINKIAVLLLIASLFAFIFSSL